MRLVFLGPPGVGKGTQAEIISSEFHCPKVSTGDILREAVRNKTPLGLQAKGFMDQGLLVPDSVVIGLVEEKLAQDGEMGFVLDGFPRTVHQAEELNRILDAHGQHLDRVIYFSVTRDELIRRLSGRRSCSKCQAVYHVDFAAPRHEGTCDRCAAPLIQRSDDRKETIEARLEVYEQQTAPLITYYRARGILSDLEGAGPIEAVHERLLGVLTANRLA